MDEAKSKKQEKDKKDEYTVIRKFNNEGESFQKVMEKLLIQKMNKL